MLQYSDIFRLSSHFGHGQIMSFTEARKFFPEEGEPLTIYISAVDQCQWVLHHVCAHFFASNSGEKMKNRSGEIMDSIRKFHKAVWPVDDFPEIWMSKKKRIGRTRFYFCREYNCNICGHHCVYQICAVTQAASITPAICLFATSFIGDKCFSEPGWWR